MKNEIIEDILEVIKNCSDNIGRYCKECDYFAYGHCMNQKLCEAEAIYLAGYRKVEE